MLIYLFRRLLSLATDLSLIAIICFPLWIQHPLFILPCGWAYFAACSAWLGQRTPGMRLAGFTLHETRPGPYVYATWLSPLCRTMLYGLPVTTFTAGLGYFPFLLLRRDGRTLHELLANTRFSPSMTQGETLEE